MWYSLRDECDYEEYELRIPMMDIEWKIDGK